MISDVVGACMDSENRADGGSDLIIVEKLLSVMDRYHLVETGDGDVWEGESNIVLSQTQDEYTTLYTISVQGYYINIQNLRGRRCGAREVTVIGETEKEHKVDDRRGDYCGSEMGGGLWMRTEVVAVESFMLDLGVECEDGVRDKVSRLESSGVVEGEKCMIE
ncbi:hypothetical protein Tco_0601431 [Tanacetum coccineum]